MSGGFHGAQDPDVGDDEGEVVLVVADLEDVVALRQDVDLLLEEVVRTLLVNGVVLLPPFLGLKLEFQIMFS